MVEVTSKLSPDMATNSALQMSRAIVLELCSNAAARKSVVLLSSECLVLEAPALFSVFVVSGGKSQVHPVILES